VSFALCHDLIEPVKNKLNTRVIEHTGVVVTREASDVGKVLLPSRMRVGGGVRFIA